MKPIRIIIATAALAATVQAQNTITPVEQAAGWKSLFDGASTSAWRGYKQQKFPDKNWGVENGTLRTTGGGGDIMTLDEYGDFEFACQFKLSEKANSGIMWRVTEKHGASYETGPEYQLLEDHSYPDKLKPAQYCGALYDMYAPAEGKTLNPAGQWNDARIWLHNGVIQHWLNGKKVVEATIFDDAGKPTKEWLDKIAASKFKDTEGFGVQPKGAIALQDHGDAVAFRNLKVRDLNAPMPGEISLFNGKNMDGWTFKLTDATKMEDVWSVKDGIMICKGNPIGYIRTTKDYTNYIIRLEWRFNPVTKKAGNSGVLLRMIGEDKVWPKSIEAQLESGNAGDFWNIDDYKMTVDKSRTNGRNTKKTHGAERPIGEWNEYEIIVDHGTITLKVNGEVLNVATDVAENAGKICLQSEGAEIQFRNIRLVELK